MIDVQMSKAITIPIERTIKVPASKLDKLVTEVKALTKAINSLLEEPYTESDKMYSTKQTCKLLSISRNSLLNLERRGELYPLRMKAGANTKKLYKKEDIQKYIDSHKEANKE